MATPKRSLKTPTKRNISNVLSPQLLQSPVIDSSIQRRLSDILINLHKHIQTWEVDNQASFQTANTLCSLYRQWDVIHNGDNFKDILKDQCKKKYHMKLIMTREDLLKQLQTHRNKLQELLIKMNGLVENLKAVYYLLLDSTVNCLNKSELREDELIEEPVIFSAWNAEKFHKTAQLLLSMYTKEYLLKKQFYNIFLSFKISDSDEDLSILNKCLSVWLHQPYIDINVKLYMDSMLFEAELK